MTEYEKGYLQALKDAYAATKPHLKNTGLLMSAPPQSSGVWDAGCSILALMRPLWVPEPQPVPSPHVAACPECGMAGWWLKPGEYRACWRECVAPKEKA